MRRDLTVSNKRLVIVLGIPFPTVADPKVILKRHFNDQQSKHTNVLNGQQWYNIQAYRALNQAIGRCIRHRKDFGCVLLLDERFVQQRDYNRRNLSSWMRSRYQTFSSSSDMIRNLDEFLSMPRDDLLPSTVLTPSSPPRVAIKTSHHSQTDFVQDLMKFLSSRSSSSPSS